MVPFVEQSNNHAGGDVVAGNKTINQFGTPPPSSHLVWLLEQYQVEVENNVHTHEKLRELQRFGIAKEEPLIPLETKLIEGKRGDLIEFAMEAKEQFTKELARHTHFPSAQKIHAHLLSKIWSVFSTRILPAIRSGQERLAVERLIQTEIIDPTLAELRSNPFAYSDTEVQGMIYYLTGNCHIRWA